MPVPPSPDRWPTRSLDFVGLVLRASRHTCAHGGGMAASPPCNARPDWVLRRGGRCGRIPVFDKNTEFPREPQRRRPLIQVAFRLSALCDAPPPRHDRFNDLVFSGQDMDRAPSLVPATFVLVSVDCLGHRRVVAARIGFDELDESVLEAPRARPASLICTSRRSRRPMPRSTVLQHRPDFAQGYGP